MPDDDRRDVGLVEGVERLDLGRALAEADAPQGVERVEALGAGVTGVGDGRGAAYSWTSSISVPNDPFGCTNATVVPREPGRGALSMGVAPASIIDLERGGAVVDPVADVVEALAALLEVLGDGGVVAGRGGELDVRVGHLHQGLLDAVGVDDLAVVDLGAERLCVVRDGGVEVVDGDGDVIDLGQQHGP